MKKFMRFAVSTTLAMLLALSPITVLGGAGGGPVGQIPPPATPRHMGVPDVEVPNGYVAFYDFRGDVVIAQQNPTSVAVFDDGIFALMMNVGFDVLGIETIAFAQRNLSNLGWRNFGNSPITIVPAGNLFMHDVEPLVYAQPQLFITGARSFTMCRYYTGVALPRFHNANHDYGFGTQAQQEQALWDALPDDMAVAHLTVNMITANLREDMRANIDILSRIFPDAADVLNARLERVELNLDFLSDFNRGTGRNAVIIQMIGTGKTGGGTGSMSLFGYNTRWSFLYDEFGFPAAAPAGFPYTMTQFSEQAQARGISVFEAQAQALLEINPDVIFLVDRSGNTVTGYGPAYEMFTNNPHIRQTNASRDGFIFSGLPEVEWYTTVGGFNSVERMIMDVYRFMQAYEDPERNAATPTPVAPVAPASRENGIRIMMNGEILEFNADSQPFVTGGRTFLPLRALAELLGLTVEFDPETNTAILE
ncbi:MAG: stalk domain-containing protein [Defluviitaleaceae bacterium]|nr:stalk domain-containing protein [Defluviitaleaceae bacterium]MCL2262289.1 stalk domain-containing protein [Defluviitaleaceae bacterium]